VAHFPNSGARVRPSACPCRSPSRGPSGRAARGRLSSGMLFTPRRAALHRGHRHITIPRRKIEPRNLKRALGGWPPGELSDRPSGPARSVEGEGPARCERPLDKPQPGRPGRLRSPVGFGVIVRVRRRPARRISRGTEVSARSMVRRRWRSSTPRNASPAKRRRRSPLARPALFGGAWRGRCRRSLRRSIGAAPDGARRGGRGGRSARRCRDGCGGRGRRA